MLFHRHHESPDECRSPDTTTAFTAMSPSQDTCRVDRSSTLSLPSNTSSSPSGDRPLPSKPQVPRVSTQATPTPTLPVRASRAVDLNELHQLREYLLKSSLCVSRDYFTKPIFIRDTQVPASCFMPVIRQDCATPSDDYYVAAQNEMTTPNPSLDDYPILESSSMSMPLGTGASLPRESLAVLIDAVRGSSLHVDAKCRFLFDLFDTDKQGVLTKSGVVAFMEATLLVNNVQWYGDLPVDEVTSKLFPTSANTMTYHQFCLAFGHTITSPASQPLHFQGHHDANAKSANNRTSWRQRISRWYNKHATEIHWLTAYFVVLTSAFVVKAAYIPYDSAVGFWPRIAKGFAQVIMVDTLFLLLPMCRNFVTFARQFQAISSRVPIDKHIDFHKICGAVLLLASLGHTIAWVCIVYYLRSVSDTLWQQSKYVHLGFVRHESVPELMERIPMWTGLTMLVIAMVAAPLTITSVRRVNFNAFWVTHLFFIPFLLLILVHGLAMWVQPPQAFYWVLPPCAIYLIEKSYRRRAAVSGQTSIMDVHFSKDTVAIFLEKPLKFHFQPGMYMYINIPVISWFEWHPFTISSAPEDNCLSIHVRNAGDWTGALHAVLRQLKRQISTGDPLDLEAHDGLCQQLYPSVYIDGPIGAPSQEFLRYKTVVFVGAGIGVTPFASILRSIVHQWQTYKCPCCQAVNLPRHFQLQKIHFYWITREQEALTWFTETMNQLSELDCDGRLEIHNYYSPLKDEAQIAPLRVLQTFIHATEGQDIVSGLATKHTTHFGRPEWSQELHKIAQQQQQQRQQEQDEHDHQVQSQPGTMEATRRRRRPSRDPVFDRVGVNANPEKEEIGVFFCGPKPMGKAIHDGCATFNMDTTKKGVVFDFRSEVF